MGYNDIVIKIIWEKEREIKELFGEEVNKAIYDIIPKALQEKLGTPVVVSKLSEPTLRLIMSEETATNLLANWENYAKRGEEVKITLLPTNLYVEYIIPPSPPQSTEAPLILAIEFKIQSHLICNFITIGDKKSILPKGVQLEYIVFEYNSPTIKIPHNDIQEVVIVTSKYIFHKDAFPALAINDAVIEDIAKGIEAARGAFQHPAGVWKLIRHLVIELEKKLNEYARTTGIKIPRKKAKASIKKVEGKAISIEFTFYFAIPKDYIIPFEVRVTDSGKDIVELEIVVGSVYALKQYLPIPIKKINGKATITFNPNDILTDDFIEMLADYLLPYLKTISPHIQPKNKPRFPL